MDDIFDYIDKCSYYKYCSRKNYNNAFKNISQIVTKYKTINHSKNFNDEIRGKFGYTPLHYAVLYNQFEVVKLLINEGADPTIRILQSDSNHEGILALYLAEQFGKIDIKDILKPYTEYNLLKKEYYNSIIHYKISNKMTIISNNYNNTLTHLYHIPTYLDTIYNNITSSIFSIYLLQNRLQAPLFLPIELWINILEFCQLKDFLFLSNK